MRINKKKSKAFTLIELLVVVAIIGALAAVGVVAYNGYTASAKKNAAKSNQASVIKYIAAELQKCNMEEDEAMDGELTCSERTTATKVQEAAIEALKDFKNPFKTNSIWSFRVGGLFRMAGRLFRSTQCPFQYPFKMCSFCWGFPDVAWSADAPL